MRVLCRHGHFAFYPKNVTEIAEFANKFGFALVPEEDYYTFDTLADADDFSLVGKTFINLPAIATFEGKPWDVMRENGFVYSLALDALVPKLSIVTIVELSFVDTYYTLDLAILQPGSRTLNGSQILSYSGEIYLDKFQIKISEFRYE